MKHTDFYSLYKEIDKKVLEELKEAVRAHGGEYVFIHYDSETGLNMDEREDAPLIVGATRDMDEYEDFYISSVLLQRENELYIYGMPKADWDFDEYLLTDYVYSHLEYIIDAIPETETVTDVSIK